ncbi:hypothetical protein FNH08_06785 [Streptomyces spongiae]|uniref:Uncharacterized protein n=1 Tax=Streptomyces spongiae TaxID=565072 RepID=A0A5N8XBJ7_9ACTN|nr:hypothetical protein [Streptomyces spongiae]
MEPSSRGRRQGPHGRALSGFVHMAADERIGALCLAKNFDQDHPDLFVARERLMELVGQMMWSPAI